MKILAVIIATFALAACSPALAPAPPEAPTSWEDGPDSCWTVTGCPPEPCQSNSMNDCLPPGDIPADEVTCLALGCPGQPAELPGDGPITP